MDRPNALANGAALMLRALIGIARTDLSPMQAALRGVLAEEGLDVGEVSPPTETAGSAIGVDDRAEDVDIAAKYAESGAAWYGKAFAEGPPAGQDRARWIEGMVADLRAQIMSQDGDRAPEDAPIRWADWIARAVVADAERTYSPSATPGDAA